MVFRKDVIEDAVVRPVRSNVADDFGINEDDLPEVDEMENGQEILENIQTRTVTEERQKIVTKTTINKFAIVGIIVGFLIVACGVCVILGLPGKLGLEIDYRLGYVLAVMGAYMFCSFGMHVKQNEFQVETFTVEKKVPVEGLPYDTAKMQQRDTEIDAKVNEMADMFQKLAMLTSELEEKIVQREAASMDDSKNAEQSEMLAQAAATAVVAAMREERLNSDEYKESEQKRLQAEQLVEESRARFDELQAKIEEGQRRAAEEAEKAAEERRIAEEERTRLAEEIRLAKEESERIAEEKRLAEEESARVAEEKARLAEEEKLRLAEEIRLAKEEAERIAEEKRLAEEESARLAEAIRLAEEKRLAEEEAARIAEEMRIEEERRRAEEEERRRLEEELRRVEEERRRAEEEAARIAEEIRLAEERRKADEAERRRVEAEKIKAEQERLASLGLSTTTFAWSSNLGKSFEVTEPEIEETAEVEETYVTDEVAQEEVVQEENAEFDLPVEQEVISETEEIYEAEDFSEIEESYDVEESVEEEVYETEELLKPEEVAETENDLGEEIEEKEFSTDVEPIMVTPIFENTYSDKDDDSAEESTGWNFGYSPLHRDEESYINVSVPEEVSEPEEKVELEEFSATEEVAVTEETVEPEEEVKPEEPVTPSQPKNIWPEIPPMGGYPYTAGNNYSSILDEQPQLTEEEERRLAEEKAERNKRIQEQISKMYQSKWNDVIPEDDFSDLDEGPIIIK